MYSMISNPIIDIVNGSKSCNDIRLIIIDDTNNIIGIIYKNAGRRIISKCTAHEKAIEKMNRILEYF